MQSTHYLEWKLNEMTQTMQLLDEMELRYRWADCKKKKKDIIGRGS